MDSVQDALKSRRRNARTPLRASLRMRQPQAYVGYWWEDPARLLLFFILPLYGLLSIDLLGAPKTIDRIYFDGFYAFVGALFLAIVTAAAWLACTTARPARPAPVEVPVHVLDLVFGLAFVGYLVMMSGVLAHPALLVGFFRGEVSAFDLLEMKGRIVGLSTLTQATAAYIALYFYVFRRPEKGFNRYKLYIVVLAVLTVIRSFIFAERLALIEMVLPFALMVARFRHAPRHWKLITLGPFAAIPLLVGFFIANEYKRSWETYYINLYDNVFDFALERLLSYYATALNNGAGILSILGWGEGHPMFTFDWQIHFPVVGETFQAMLDGSADILQFLNGYADPEFNNPSGIFVHFYEWGWFALAIAALIGWVFGRCYAGWRSGDGFWCCMHAVSYVSLLEMLRIPNLFAGRNFVPVALLFVVFQFMAKTPRRSTRAVGSVR